ncbi:flavodoxin family protein [Ectobacillus panaciterrae]|uniref:flavodoxin family protein n=1 Tax=Ectobacillus panaciterrae TaxID=363872 RepID=UPI000404C546|nr:flavodoxin family protein [Ectobacillus panaciterrae]
MLVIHGSSRAGGNTEQLAHLMAEGIEAEHIYLRDKTIVPIIDKRHDPEGFTAVEDDYDGIAKEMLNHDTIIFATPLYWYGMSGHMKNFVDRWSQSLRDQQLRFAERMKDKKCYVIIVGGDNPKLKALPLVAQFQYIFDFMKASFAGYIVGEANTPGAIMNDQSAIGQANIYNKQLKQSK